MTEPFYLTSGWGGKTEMNDYLWDAYPLIYKAANDPRYAEVRDELLAMAQEIQTIHERF